MCTRRALSTGYLRMHTLASVGARLAFDGRAHARGREKEGVLSASTSAMGSSDTCCLVRPCLRAPFPPACTDTYTPIGLCICAGTGHHGHRSHFVSRLGFRRPWALSCAKHAGSGLPGHAQPGRESTGHGVLRRRGACCEARGVSAGGERAWRGHEPSGYGRTGAAHVPPVPTVAVATALVHQIRPARR